MAYTTIAQVRLHVVNPAPVQTQPVEQQISLPGTSWQSFYSGQVVVNSIELVAQRSSALTRVTIALLDGSIALPNPPLQPESAVVASDSSLGHTFLPDQDYHLDYQTGLLSRTSGGALAVDQKVTVWYRAEHRYVRDLDYELDSTRGRVRRIAGGGIPENETVLLRYEPAYGAFPDDLMEQATAEANRLIEATVDPQREFGADPLLAQAATYAALAIVCRTAATRDLVTGSGLEKNAAAWLSLAESYQAQSQQLLSTFRPPTPRPNPPRLT